MFRATRVVAVEVEVVAAVKPAEAFEFVLDRMAVDYVHDHGYAHAVGFVNEPRFRSSECAEAR